MEQAIERPNPPGGLAASTFLFLSVRTTADRLDDQYQVEEHGYRQHDPGKKSSGGVREKYTRTLEGEAQTEKDDEYDHHSDSHRKVFIAHCVNPLHVDF